MFDLGFWELLFVGVIALVVLGPERLPVAARTVGRWVGQARAYARSLSNELDREVHIKEVREQVRSAESEIRSGFRSASQEVRAIADSEPEPEPEPAPAPATATATAETTPLNDTTSIDQPRAPDTAHEPGRGDSSAEPPAGGR